MKKISKRMLSLVLSALLVVTMLPTFAFTALADDEYFLMTYFTGNLQTEQQIRFAVSTNGKDFKPLYGGNAVLQEKSTDTHSYDGYTNTDGVRDPYIFKSPADGYYYCIATDLEATAYGFWGNQSQMVIWRSADLINWSDAYYINVAQICNSKRGTNYSNSDFQRTWAPEIFYENGQYMVYFALAGGDYQATRMHYMTTDNLMDWTHYSAPQVLYDPGYDDIDADIVKQGDTYYMFYKDETPGRSTVCLATATNMTGPYTYVGQFGTSSNTGAIEGCEVYTVGGNYYLVADRFGAAGNFAIYNMGSSLAAVANAVDNDVISVTDGNPISTVEELYGFTNLTPRHGSIVHITQDEYNDLVADSGGVTNSDIMYNFTTSYSIDATGWRYETYNDSSLHDINVMMKENGSSIKIPHDGGYATLRNTTFFVNDEDVRSMLPDDVYTVSFDYSLESAHSAPIFALGTGAGAPSVNTDYVMLFGNGDMWVRKTGESSDTYVANAPLTLGVTYHYDIVSDGTNVTFYRDGEVIGSIATTVDFPSSGTRYAAFGFTDGHSSAGYGYGTYSHIRFRDSAVSQSTLNSELNKNLVYSKAGGSETVDGKSGVLDVSKSGGHNLVEPFISHTASSYTLAGWVNPGAAVNGNVIMGIGNRKWTPAPYGRYLAVREDGTILFNYCSGSNNGGNWSEHFFDASAFTLSANTWSYLQINIVPINNNQVKLTVWKDGTQTYQSDITLTTKVDGNNTTGNDYSYGMLGFMQLPTNNVFLGNMDVPSWWQVEGDTSYIKDVRVYTQAMDPANLYEAQVAEDYVESNINTISSTPTFGAAAYHEETEAKNSNGTKHYSNLAYGSKDTAWGEFITITNTNTKIALPKNIVGVYDGVSGHDVSIPILFENYRTNASSQRYKTLFPTDSNLKFVDYWYGYTNGYNYGTWPGTTKSSSSYDDRIGYAAGKDNETGTQDNNTHRFWYNQLFYNGSGNTSDYYDLYSGFQMDLYSKNNSNAYSNHYFNTTSDGKFYVINYKPVYDMVAGTTKVPNTNKSAYSLYIDDVVDKEWMYTKESLDQFYKALYYIIKANPNGYDYGGTGSSSDSNATAADVATCTSYIKKAVDEFAKINLIKKEFNINYYRTGGFYSETVTAGDNLVIPPTLTATHYNGGDTLKHTTYSWKDDNAPTTSHMPRSDEDYTEIATVGDCNSNGTNYVQAQNDTNGYTEHPCTVCSHVDTANNVWDDRSADWTAYNAVADTISAKAADTQYTTDSRNAYAAACAEVTNNIDTSASKSKSYIDRQKDALTTAERKLNPVADYSALNTAVTDSDKIAAKGAYDSYTYSSWVPYATAYNAGNTLNNTTPATKANQPKFKTDSDGYITGTPSDKQAEINTKTDAIKTAYSALVAVPVEQYTVYETARRNIVDSLDSRKYNADGIATITGNTGAVTTADSELYKTLDGSEASAYSTLTGVEFAEGAQVRNCATAATVEGDTESILTASTNLNASENKASYINRYAVNFSVQNDGGTTVYTNNTNPYYGESVDLTVPAEKLNGYNVALWSTTNFDDDGTTSTGSQKASGRVGSTYTKVVSGNMAVVAELEKTTDDMGENVKRYDICDAYGSVIDVIYSKTAKDDLTYSGATVTIGADGSVTAKSIPFYSFNSWTCTDVSANHYKLAPQYEVTQTYDIDIVGASNVTAKSGTVTSTSRIENVVYDSLVTITSSDANFAAWAVKTSANEYQIASYNSTCSFYACADEDYVAIVSDDNGGYKTVDATPVAITGANIDGAVASGATLTADQKTALVNDKIANHKPFIAIQNVKMTDKQARVYARITQGATGNTGYGVLYKSGNNPTEETFAGATKRTVTSALSTGQFTYTLNSKTTFKVDNVTFRTFVNYPAKYKYNNTDYEINGTDYSEIVVATKNA